MIIYLGADYVHTPFYQTAFFNFDLKMQVLLRKGADGLSLKGSDGSLRVLLLGWRPSVPLGHPCVSMIVESWTCINCSCDNGTTSIVDATEDVHDVLQLAKKLI